MKEGEEDDNAIATTAASSLLALVNGLDRSNNFNQLDEMQNHMSTLITAQNEKKTGKNNNTKTPRKTKQILVPILQAHQNTKKKHQRKA
jgi:hypothetical protein